MKKVKWFVMILLVVLFLTNPVYAMTTEEQQYLFALHDHLTQVDVLTEDISNTLSHATADSFNDPSWLIELIIKISNLDRVAGEAKTIPCPERFRESNSYYLQSMGCMQQFSTLFIQFIKTGDEKTVDSAMSCLKDSLYYMEKFDVAWHKELEG